MSKFQDNDDIQDVLNRRCSRCQSVKIAGLPLVFFQNFSRFLKIRIFKSIFSNLRLKIVLKNLKTLKRYCKGSLNMFLNKKIFDDDKKKLSMGKIFCVNGKFYY